MSRRRLRRSVGSNPACRWVTVIQPCWVTTYPSPMAGIIAPERDDTGQLFLLIAKANATEERL